MKKPVRKLVVRAAWLGGTAALLVSGASAFAQGQEEEEEGLQTKPGMKRNQGEVSKPGVERRLGAKPGPSYGKKKATTKKATKKKAAKKKTTKKKATKKKAGKK